MRTWAVAVLGLVFFATGCSSLMGRLRADLNDDSYSDAPVTGGLYPEGGYLESDQEYPSHYDRSPASSRQRAQGASWVSRVEAREDLVLQGSEPPTASDKEDRENSVPVAPKRFTRADFVDQAQESGSLWSSGGESNFFFSKNRARSPGDIISIKIEGEMLRDIASEVKRTLTRNERERELDLLEARTQRQPAASASATPAPAGNAPAQDQVATSAAAPETSETGFSAVDVTGSLGLKAGDTLLAEIAERFPNGNYKVRGMKRVPYRNSTKLISFTGVVRGNDLAGEEPVPSGKIYEYRLQTVQ